MYFAQNLLMKHKGCLFKKMKIPVFNEIHEGKEQTDRKIRIDSDRRQNIGSNGVVQPKYGRIHEFKFGLLRLLTSCYRCLIIQEIRLELVADRHVSDSVMCILYIPNVLARAASCEGPLPARQAEAEF